MKIAALSDIHGNLAALDAVLDDVRRRGADVIVNLGDILSGALHPPETADRLIALDLPTIKGNHERQLLTGDRESMRLSDRWAHDTLRADHLEWIAALPERMTLDDDVLMVHGTPDSDLVYFLETVTPDGCRAATPDEIAQRAGDEPASLILCGHTHLRARLDDGRLVVNPGSVGLQAYMDDLPHPHRIETRRTRATRWCRARPPAGTSNSMRSNTTGTRRPPPRPRAGATTGPSRCAPAGADPPGSHRAPSASLHSPGNRTAMPFRRNCSSCPAHRAAPLSGNRSPAFSRILPSAGSSATRASATRRSGRRRFRQPRASCAGNDRPADRRDRAIDGRRDRDARGARQTRTDHAPRADGHVRRPRHGRPARRTGAPVSRKRTRSSPTGS